MAGAGVARPPALAGVCEPSGGNRVGPGGDTVPGGRVHADGDVAVEDAVLGPPALDDTGRRRLVGTDPVERPVAVREAGGRRCHRHCRPPVLLRPPARALRRWRRIPRGFGHPRFLRPLSAASGSLTSGTRAITRPARATPPMTTVPTRTVTSDPARDVPTRSSVTFRTFSFNQPATTETA